jgi:hypothetical protein
MKALVTYVSVALTAAIGSTCHAETVIAGAGALTCGQFANHYAKNPQVELSYFAWAQGFMSSMNVSRADSPSPAYRDLSGPIEFQMSQIRIYCDDHPLAQYSDAVFDLFGSLPLLPMPPKSD